MRVLVTGATGIVGRQLCRRLSDRQHEVVVALRSLRGMEGLEPALPVVVGDIDSYADWTQVLVGVDVVVHLAARVHQVRETAPDPATAYRRTNTEATRKLVEAALRCGVRRFVFVSTAQVNGLSSHGQPFTEQDEPRPDTDYAHSKLEAEVLLASLCTGQPMEYVIVRPPLVYGPGIKGNLYRLMQLVMTGLPLPFGSVSNRRSMIGLGNLVDFLETCLAHPSAANQSFLVSDGCDLSTPEVIGMLARGFGMPVRILACPVSVLVGLATLFGKGSDMKRLCGSFQVDSSKAERLLGWHPVIPSEAGMHEMAAWFMSERKRQDH